MADRKNLLQYLKKQNSYPIPNSQGVLSIYMSTLDIVFTISFPHDEWLVVLVSLAVSWLVVQPSCSADR